MRKRRYLLHRIRSRKLKIKPIPLRWQNKKSTFSRKGEVLLLALCGISIAPRAQIWIYMYIIFLVRCRSHFMCEYRLPIGKYRAALRHIDCAEGANIDLHIVPSSTADATAVPLLHKARQSRAGEGW